MKDVKNFTNIFPLNTDRDRNKHFSISPDTGASFFPERLLNWVGAFVQIRTFPGNFIAKDKGKETQMKRTNYKHLTHEQQLEIFKENKGLAVHISKRYTCRPDLYEDKEQEAMAGLWEGILKLDNYDPKKSDLSTFLGWYIQNRLSRFVLRASNSSGLSAGTDAIKEAWEQNKKSVVDAKKALLVGVAHSLDYMTDEDDMPFENLIGQEDVYDDGIKEAVESLLSSLDKRRRDLICQRYGIGCEPVTRREMSEARGISVKNLDYRIKKSIDKLRDTPGSSSLRVYL